MEDPPGSYAPRSPDLSALASSSAYSANDPYTIPPQQLHTSSYPQPPTPIRHDSFSLPQSSYYQPPSLLQAQSSSSYGYPAYSMPDPQQDQPSSPQSKRVKRDPDDQDWSPQVQQQQQTKPGRPPSSKKASKSSAAAAAKAEEAPEPHAPAPGEVEGIVVRTKFPVARIKRIVQADDEVGKVAQATPVAVGKALELFMIHLTLASASIATGAGAGERKSGGGGTVGKRITGAHIKTAILKHDEFDFLRPIADKIPDGPGGSGKGAEGKTSRAKADSEEDADLELDDGALDGDADGTYGSRSKRKGAGRERSGRRMQLGME